VEGYQPKGEGREDAASPQSIKAGDLDDRQIRGVQRAAGAGHRARVVGILDEHTTIWMSKRGNRAWRVERSTRNRRGILAVEYTCSCGDFKKNGRIDCEHVFAERIRRAEVVVEGEINRKRAESARTGRAPTRIRISPVGKSMRRIQREARVTLAERIPKLVQELGGAVRQTFTAAEQRPQSTAALALVFKLTLGKSADEMISEYRDLIERGLLDLRRAPHPNTITRWMNDSKLTPILKEMLKITARPFRALEVSGMVDSSKMSQMRSAHSRWVEYGDDEREAAVWMKMHVLVGVETLACMAVIFSGSQGKGTHDINFILPLLEKAQGLFSLRYVLADKAYLSEDVVGTLWQAGIQAVIPLKKRWNFEKAERFYEPLKNLVQWYDDRQADFHNHYRVRVKIESYFSLVKRVADGYCWSRGRPRKDAEGNPVANDFEPCIAWQNETLCKLIFVNLRHIVQWELATGYKMNFLKDTFFKALPDEDRLIA
jgi:hypothetical protein